jgi:hypothetical protein
MSSSAKRSTAQLVSPPEYSGSNTLQQLDQGVYVNDINTLFGSAFTKLRSNNDFLKIRFGIPMQMTEGFFDDTESPSSLVLSGTSGSITVYEKSQIVMNFSEKRAVETSSKKMSGVTLAPSHYLLDYDFGQPDFFQDGTSYTDKNSSINPLWLIDVNPVDLPSLISEDMVNSTELISTDGVIDPFSVRKEVDRSFIEVPFRYKGVRGDLVNDNAYRRSTLIVDEHPTVLSRLRVSVGGSPGLFSTDPFLDAGDVLGLDDLSTSEDIGPINSEGYLIPESLVSSPYVDSDDSKLTCGLLGDPDSDPLKMLVNSLTGSAYFPTHDQLSRDHVSLAHGFVYDNNYTGIESIAFGGLLK